jgi:hypothetical protein
MSAEHLKELKERFHAAYTPLISGQRAVKNAVLADVYRMKVEFDAAMALVGHVTAETDWVRSVLAEHGYSGPLAEASCPLREWLQPKETQPVPATFTEYCFDHDERGRIICFSLKEATDRMAEFAAKGEKFEFSTAQYKFADEWSFACSMLKQGQSLSPVSRYALKVGTDAGMLITL